MPSTQATRPAVAGLRDRPHAQVLIVGGGINGVATFRYLALQGIDVALIERGDYCQGASGASSHMIHGGIRYLENGEFRLVRESVQERNTLLAIAPHYVKPLRTTIPIFSTFSGILSAPARFLTHRNGKPQERGALLIKAGLMMYDAFAGSGRLTERHRFHGRRRALAELPALRPDVKYAATYFDASVHNPERLTLDVLHDGLAANPEARACNYLSLVSEHDGVARLRDELTGEEFDVAAPVIVNATGAWVDATNEALGQDSRFMGGTKGSHIVLDSPELLAACGGREIFFEHSDGRIVLVYPMGDRVLVGTTDLEADMDEPARCTDAEVDYFFELIGHVFPGVAVSRDEIVYRFSGVRPLPRHDDTQPGFVSRDYRIEQRHGAGGTTVLSLVGGKWTTFRALAEHLGVEVLQALGRPAGPDTRTLAIGGGVGYPRTAVDRERWISARTDRAGRERLAVLLERYGTRADEVLAATGADAPLEHCAELGTGELAHMGRTEQVGRLVDVFIRRTSLAFRGLVTEELIAECARLLAPVLGWDAERTAAERGHTRRVLTEEHGVVFGHTRV
ncbi:FAD-dependent oxidoreductase [Arthrobacter sp. JSM 101049]|uniref:glycerol-3-phosphate dehydrogenase/oxidase n=1 Tax=Arthrobacter sp. JSM 101049 TaxID=929097 RepID=UPI00356715AD